MEDSLEKLCIPFIVSLKLVYIFRRIKVEDTMYNICTGEKERRI